MEITPLIEPEWNVNLIGLISLYLIIKPLIEPEWNVNLESKVFPRVLDAPLIEPEWNVNQYGRRTREKIQCAFNRTRMKCKF